MCYLVTFMHENGHPEFHTKCRKCLECRQERAREWGLRNMLEAEQHTTGCFITLTYDEQHNPVVLVKKDLQDFKKRLRKKIKVEIKTFDCGEYGDRTYRPHFHMLIHGYDFPDKYVERQSDRGYNIYNSPELEKVWGKGLVTVQDLTMNAAAYCALYAAKPTKFLPEHLQEHPEFNTMSKSLGLAAILENMDTYLLTDEIFFDGRKYRIPQTALNRHYSDVLQSRRGRARLPYHPSLNPLSRREIEYDALKAKRRAKGDELWQAQLHQVPDAVEVYAQKKYRAENRQKRLSNPL